MRAVLDEIENADNYQLDGEECVLNYEGRVENAISNCIKFHKENHTFVAKNGKFDEKQWNNWMYYYYNPGKVKNPEDYITSCFICLEMAEQKDKWNFHNSLEAVIAKYDGITSTNTLDHYSDFDSIRMLGVLYQALERYE